MTNRRDITVAVVAPRPVPYQRGGAERHWDALTLALNEAGFEARLVAIDAPESTLLEVLTSYRTFLELDLSAFDVVISGKYPSWMVRHPRHLRHLNHPLRGLYERYPTHLREPSPATMNEVRRQLDAGGAPGLLDWAIDVVTLHPGHHPFPGPLARAVIQALDADAARHITTQAVVSEHVAARPGYLPPEADVAVIAPLTDLVGTSSGPDPGAGTDRTTTSEVTPGRHFLAFGRLTPIKRLDLTIEAFAASDATELRIAGAGPEESRLRALARATPGVHLLGHCDDAELARQIATARAIIATPADEDYGLVAAEAMATGRPVITTTDSGGVAEQVEHRVNGLVTAPLARSIGRAIDQLDRDPMLADRLGRAGRELSDTRTWDPLIRLVDDLSTPASARPRILVLSTFPAHPVQGGGARRLRSTAAALQPSADVTVMTLTNNAPGVRRRILDDGVVQISVGRSRAHLRADAQMAALVGLPVDDIASDRLSPSTPAWQPMLTGELLRCDAVVLAHPFLVTSLESSLSELPAEHVRPVVVYDAYNVETDLKADLLADRPGRGRLVEWCTAAEGAAVELADLVAATSTHDLARLGQLFGRTEGLTEGLVVANGVDDELLVEPTTQDRRLARRRLLTDLALSPDDVRPIALFVGSNHPPNHVAADLLDRVAAEHPELLIVLAGAHSDRARPHAHSLGRFADRSLRRVLWGADVALNPVSSGSGTNLKLVEALAAGLPVISTTVGARGLTDPDATVILVDGDEPSSIAEAILRTVAEIEARDLVTIERVSERAAMGRTVAAELAWSRCIRPLEEELRRRMGVQLPRV